MRSTWSRVKEHLIDQVLVKRDLLNYVEDVRAVQGMG